MGQHYPREKAVSSDVRTEPSAHTQLWRKQCLFDLSTERITLKNLHSWMSWPRKLSSATFGVMENRLWIPTASYGVVTATNVYSPARTTGKREVDLDEPDVDSGMGRVLVAVLLELVCDSHVSGLREVISCP